MNKSNIARTALFLFADTEYKLNMAMYQIYGDYEVCGSYFVIKPELSHECLTSCCFAGYGPLALENALGGETWVQYINRTYDLHSEQREFLFNPCWPNDRRKACERALDLLENGTVADSWNYISPFKNLSDVELIKRLKKFI